MALPRLLKVPVFAAFFACACSGADRSSNAITSQPGTGGNAGSGEVPSLGGSKNQPQPSAGERNAAGSKSNEEEAGAAGMSANASAGQAGALDEPAPPPPPPSCELEQTCSASCERTKVHCGVEFTGFSCEFEGFQGATAEVSCGQRAVVGTACCGGCGCTPVEVYFDGTYCWQGMPQCELEQFKDRVFLAHLPTTPNTTFTPPSDLPGSFYLGNGGVGGRGPTSESGSGGSTDAEGGRSGADSGGSDSGLGGAGGDRGSAE